MSTCSVSRRLRIVAIMVFNRKLPDTNCSFCALIEMNPGRVNGDISVLSFILTSVTVHSRPDIVTLRRVSTLQAGAY